MKLSAAVVYGIFVALAVCGCVPALQPEKPGAGLPGPGPAEHPLLSSAGAAVLAAREAGFEWLVTDPAAGNQSVTFSQLLAIAKTLAERGETASAERIAERLIRLSGLALEQAGKAKTAQPDYPPADRTE